MVAPTSVLFNWAEEIRRFRPALSVNLYPGRRRILDPAANVAKWITLCCVSMRKSWR